MKVVSYNIHYAVGKDDRYDLERIAAAVADADIIALQEGERYFDSPQSPPQPENIAALLGEHYWVYLDDALDFTGLKCVHVKHKPRLLSDNGPCYISGELSDYLQGNGMTHTRGRPYHPQTQGKIQRWHHSMKNQILLNNYYLPGELQEHLHQFVNHYNHERYHESLDNLTPADVFYGRGQAILDQRAKIKLNTLAMRRKMHYDNQTIYTTR